MRLTCLCEWTVRVRVDVRAGGVRHYVPVSQSPGLGMRPPCWDEGGRLWLGWAGGSWPWRWRRRRRDQAWEGEGCLWGGEEWRGSENGVDRLTPEGQVWRR